MPDAYLGGMSHLEVLVAPVRLRVRLVPATPILILETLLAATGGATIGFFTGALFGEVAFGGNAAAAIAATSAGLNGLLGGIRRTYG